MDYRYLQLRVEKPIATLTLNRSPDNLLDLDMMEEMNRALLQLRGAQGIHVLVVRGAGGVFSAGLDLQEHVRDRVQRLVQLYSRIFETIRMMDVVAVAAVQGRAWGAGFELALGCNLILADERASFALPEIRQGIIPMIAAIILPRVTPRRKAMEWILTGLEVPAHELERFGLVNRVLGHDGFEDELAGFVEALAQTSGPALQLAKRAQYEAYYSTYEEALYKVQNLYLRELLELEDAEEGVRAFLAGRPPQWRHR